MASGYVRIMAAHINSTRRCLGALVGIAQGLLCDGVLTDDEIRFLKKWFHENDDVCDGFPGSIVFERVKEVLDDGKITEDERDYLVKVLRDLIGSPDTDIAAAARVTELAYDTLPLITFPDNRFCLTGEFIHGPRRSCEAEILGRGGVISKSVTKKLNYLVIGSLGSIEWKHGSFGGKIEVAMKHKQDGVPIAIVKEDVWRESLKRL